MLTSFPPRRSHMLLLGSAALAGLVLVYIVVSNIGFVDVVFTTGTQIAALALAVSGTVMGTLMHTRTNRQAAAQRIQELETRLHESEERFRQAQKMEAMGQLAGGIAHDFNNLVTVIRCSVGLLTEYVGPDGAGAEELAQIREAAERAGTLTRQLLAFSRRQALEARPIDLNLMIRDLVKMLDRILGAHIRVHTDLDDSIAPIFADLGQMEQVVVNLAVNARDAMQNTGGAMYLSTDMRVLTTEMPRLAGADGQRIGDGTVIPPGSYVTLSIRDTGTGITPDVLQRVFDPFFTTKVQGQGTGLGLSIAQGIIHQAGGYISVDSIPDTGTTLTLHFPTPIERQREVAEERRS